MQGVNVSQSQRRQQLCSVQNIVFGVRQTWALNHVTVENLSFLNSIILTYNRNSLLELNEMSIKSFAYRIYLRSKFSQCLLRPTPPPRFACP